MNVGNKVMNDLENPKMFVTFNKFHYILRIPIHFSEESAGFNRLSRGSMTQNRIRTVKVSTYTTTLPNRNYYTCEV
jgi:hypothetical protein